MRSRYFRRLKDIYALIRAEGRAYLCSLVGLAKARLFFDKRRVNRLEIGPGPEAKEGFITVDLNFQADFPYDLRLGLPFPDESLDLIYSEHVLEHLRYPDLMALLRDCYRTLKPNAVFSLAVPNARIYLEAYSQPERLDPQIYCTYETGLSFKARINYVNYISYMDGEHRHMFDAESIVALLSEVGLRSVRLRSFDPALDQQSRRHESLYAEGVK